LTNGDNANNGRWTGDAYMNSVDYYGGHSAKWVQNKAPFNAIGYHLYVCEACRPSQIGPVVTGYIRAIRRHPYRQNMQVYVTEMGWSVNASADNGKTTLGEKGQAANLTAGYRALAANPAVPVAAWFEFQEDGPLGLRLTTPGKPVHARAALQAFYLVPFIGHTSP